MNEFPRAILHLDRDAFFVACEVARNPSLKGKPVVTGGERHIASAMSYEAKARGVTRGMPTFQIRKVCPEAVILPSDYKTYQLYSERMYEIVRRLTGGAVEEYSIDECFADITGLDRERGKTFESILREIQNSLFRELGISFSMGLSLTKVLAKIASKHNKPKGLTLIGKSQITEHLKNLPVGKIWGIGGQTSAYLLRRGVKTAGDFVLRGEEWVKENCAKPYHEIWLELCGVSVYKVNPHAGRVPKSLSSTGTFYPVSNEKSFIFSELSKHIEHVTHRARMLSLAAGEVSFFLKTSNFSYQKGRVVLPHKTALPQVIVSFARGAFDKLFDQNQNAHRKIADRATYRATGATLYGLLSSSQVEQDLFGESAKLDSSNILFSAVDALSEKFGSSTIFLCSSLGSRNQKIDRKKFFNIPFLGRTH